MAGPWSVWPHPQQAENIFEHGERFAESIAPGAFARTLQQRAGKVPLFALHESKRLPLDVGVSKGRSGIVC